MNPTGEIEQTPACDHTLRAGAGRTALAWAAAGTLCAATAMKSPSAHRGLLTAITCTGAPDLGDASRDGEHRCAWTWPSVEGYLLHRG